jgi:putative AlgH/UPF0301 family transcriptional regulator
MPTSNSLAKILLRSLLRVSKKYDQEPQLKALLKNPWLRTFRAQEILKRQRGQYEDTRAELHLLLRQYAGSIFKSEFSENYIPQTSFVDTVKKYFADHKDLKGEKLERAIDSAFMALKELNNNAFKAAKLDFQKPILRQELQGLFPNEVVEIAPNIRPGIFLVAHPLMEPGLFSRSVVLICKHSDFIREKNFESRYKVATTGLVVNTAYDKKNMEQSKQNVRVQLGPFGVIVVDPSYSQNLTLLREDESTKYLAQTNKLKQVRSMRYGGPVEGLSAIFKRTENILDEKEVKGLVPVGKELFWGQGETVQTIDNMMSQGRVPDSEVAVYKGMATWTPGQLENELRHGWWIKVSCSHNFIWDMANLPNVTNEDIWNMVMSKLGGEYASWVNFPRDLTVNEEEAQEEEAE